jgi:hypothetical protein
MNVKDVVGKLLVICRAGCSIQSILDATNSTWDVLFEGGKPYAYQRELKKAFPASDVLRALAFEALVVCVIAADVKLKKEISEADWDRLAIAYQRIDSARKLALGDD